mgnify:CR=1 FL=1
MVIEKVHAREILDSSAYKDYKPSYFNPNSKNAYGQTDYLSFESWYKLSFKSNSKEISPWTKKEKAYYESLKDKRDRYIYLVKRSNLKCSMIEIPDDAIARVDERGRLAKPEYKEIYDTVERNVNTLKSDLFIGEWGICSGILGNPLAFGNGSLGFVMANVLKYKFPDSKIVVIGRNLEKLKIFSFVDEVYSSDDIPEDFSTDHGFECAGGPGSEDAINNIIKYIKPQGSIMLMGVSENKVAINTRDILEKGLTLIGCSRSGRVDFQEAVKMLGNKKIQNRFKSIVFEDDEINSVDDIHRFFKNDLNTPFKTVAKWNI